ncbi:MAG: hypothetical protein ABI900_13795 [Betaproteobacteria bacterium]
MRAKFAARVGVALVALLVGFASPALAQEKFDKPVRLLVGFAAGGTADIIARVVADKLKDTLGQPVISACCSAARSASTWCTSPTRGRPRTSTS